MKFSLTFIVCLGVFFLNAQEGKLLLDVKGLPVRDGKIFEYKGTGCYFGGVEIISKTDSVFSVVDGKVVSVFYLDNEYSVVVKDKKGMFFIFSKLASTTAIKGGVINKGDWIGIIKPDDDNALSLLFIISTKSAKFLGDIETSNFLEKINPISCTSNNYPIVAR